MPLRMLLYTVLFWEHEWKDLKQRPPPRPKLRLTPVVPVVFHTGMRTWGSPRRLTELLGGPQVFRQFAPQYQPLSWDLAERNPADLIGRAAAWLQALAVVRAEDPGSRTNRSDRSCGVFLKGSVRPVSDPVTKLTMKPIRPPPQPVLV